MKLHIEKLLMEMSGSLLLRYAYIRVHSHSQPWLLLSMRLTGIHSMAEHGMPMGVHQVLKFETLAIPDILHETLERSPDSLLAPGGARTHAVWAQVQTQSGSCGLGTQRYCIPAVMQEVVARAFSSITRCSLSNWIYCCTACYVHRGRNHI